MSTRVAVIGGGPSSEHTVSLASAAGVSAALAAVRTRAEPTYDVVALTINRTGAWCDGGQRPIGLADAVQLLQGCAVAVPVLHGPGGEDGTVAALCELAGVAYVGSGVRGGALAMDKWATKQIARGVGVAATPDVLLTRTTAAAYWFDHPVVVKPVAAGSSHGVRLVREAADLAPALDAAFALDTRVLVEDLVVGREIDVAVLARPDGSRLVAPSLEILLDPAGDGLFDSAKKYDGSAAFQVPASLDDAERTCLEASAVAVYDAVGCAGVARIDFFLTDAGPVLNEVNTTPGMTEQSQVPRMFAAMGISYVDLVDTLVRDVLTVLTP